MIRHLRRALSLGLLAGLGCTPRVQPIAVTIYTKACKFSDGRSSPNPTDGVDNYQVSVSASDLATPVTQTFAAGTAPKFDNIPAGTGRVMTVTGYHGKPGSGGTVQAVGTSAPFDVVDPPDPKTPINIAVVLRAAGKFSGATVTGKPDTCAELRVPRAGHAATLLNDGRVLITGGFSINAAAANLPLDQQLDERNHWDFHGETEIIDPITGTVTKGQDMVIGGDISQPHATTERAFHSANMLPNGQVLVLGGETVPGNQVARTIYVPTVAALYDPGANNWIFPAVGAGKRSRHSALTDAQGRILYLGGLDYSSDASNNPFLVTNAYWLDPTSVQLKAADPSVTFAAQGFASSTWLNGQFIVAAGGTDIDGGAPGGPTVAFFKFANFPDGGSNYTQYSPADLSGVSIPPPARRGLVAAAVGGDGGSLDHVLIAGGWADGSDPTADTKNLQLDTAHATSAGIPPMLGSSDVLKVGRADLCATTLTDGRALTVGGETASATSPDAELYQLNAAGALKQVATAQLFSSRKFHTCTTLHDGSVLVVGGLQVDRQAQTAKVLSSIEVYTPVPTK